MPKHDEPTAIRQACDIDVITESAWSIVEQRGWRATPELIFALVEHIKDLKAKDAEG